MEPLVTLLVIVFIVCLAYYIALRITKDSTFAFIVGVVALFVGLVGKGFIG